MIVVNLRDYQQTLRSLQHVPEDAEKAARQTVQRARDKAFTEALRGITGTYNIKRGMVLKGSRPNEKSMWKTPVVGSGTNYAASVQVSGSRTPIYRFGPKPSKVDRSPQKRPVVTFNILKGKSNSLPSSFIAQMQSGHTGLFRRVGAAKPMLKGRYVGKKRPPIFEEFSLSVAEMLKAHKVIDPLTDLIVKFFENELDRQIDRFLHA